MTQPLLQPDKKTFHHGSLETPRLKKLLSFLKERGPSGATTFEITMACHTLRAYYAARDRCNANGTPANWRLVQ